VLVVDDLLGINETTPKLAKKYADLRQVMTDAVTTFVHDVETGAFPDSDHSYS
jgi:3-methyl-2-oxobutanoate hydroxymethyltransferase